MTTPIDAQMPPTQEWIDFWNAARRWALAPEGGQANDAARALEEALKAHAAQRCAALAESYKDAFKDGYTQGGIDALTQPSAVVQEPVNHLRQYGDVTEAEMAKYMATGAMGKVKPTAQPEISDEILQDISCLLADVISMPGMNSITTPGYAVAVALWLSRLEEKRALAATPPPVVKVEPTAQPSAVEQTFDDEILAAHQLLMFEKSFVLKILGLVEGIASAGSPIPREISTWPLVSITKDSLDHLNNLCKSFPEMEERHKSTVKVYYDILYDDKGNLKKRNPRPTSAVEPTAQPAERNFCERCGQRVGDDTYIHTCTPPVAGDAANEAAAKKLYETWHSLPGYVLWQDGGNSLIQDEARKLSRIAAIAAGGGKS